MSDLKLVNLRNNNLLSNQKLSVTKLQELVEAKAEEVFGLRIIASKYVINNNANEIIETLALDENYVLVIIEYRSGKFSKLINKGLVYVDYIKGNISKFKMLVNDKLGLEEGKRVKFNPRLIIIGDDFNKYDEYAIKQMNIDIDLIKYQMFDKAYLLFEKNYQSLTVNHQLFTFKFPNRESHSLYRLISDFTLSLGDEVVETGIDEFLSYRKIKNFMYLSFNNGLEVSLRVNDKYKMYMIKNERDFNKIQGLIEQAYDEN